MSRQTPRSLPRTRGKLKAVVRAVDDLQPIEIERMYQIFSAYYSQHDRPTFIRDLSEKNDVILLVDDGRIQGFSTLLQVAIRAQGKRAMGIYSGDTVLEKAYWGSPALGIAFLKYLWLQKVKHPFQPLYWFLISKGYKTYLLMANNFSVHYPRFEKPTPAYFDCVLNEFYQNKFDDLYDPSTRLIRPVGESCRLKENVADIESSLLKIPRIAFFQNSNPDWKLGIELACVARMTLVMPLKYSLKKLFKNFFRKKPLRVTS